METFSYSYSAPENKEIQEIRKRYLPQEESKLEELKRLDMQVQNFGMTEALCAGILGSLIFGLGLCMAMQVLGTGVAVVILGILIGIVGVAGILVAYPLYRAKQQSAREKYSPRILELVEELSK